MKLSPKIGDRFGRIVVISQTEVMIGMKGLIVKCDCGSIKVTGARLLVNGNVKSCGCLRKELSKKNAWRHGLSKRPEYHIWSSMKVRCYKKKHDSYPWYGGRGIRVCPRWRSSFKNFFEDVGPRPSKNHSLNRKNNNGHYEPKNVEWADRRCQANNVSTNVRISFRGVTDTVTNWARKIGVRPGTLRQRLFISKWTVERSLTAPLRVYEK